MTNAQILEKAIQKAIRGGWQPGWQDKRPITSWDISYSDDFDEGEGVLIRGLHARSSASTWFWPLKELIFNHDFAKAIWGDKQVSSGKNRSSIGQCEHFKPAWVFNLQQMVIAENTIKYLGEHLND